MKSVLQRFTGKYFAHLTVTETPHGDDTYKISLANQGITATAYGTKDEIRELIESLENLIGINKPAEIVGDENGSTWNWVY